MIMPTTAREEDGRECRVVADGENSESCDSAGPESCGSDGSESRGRERSEACCSGASSSDEEDELRQLGERIADLAARINAAEGRMMALLADFDRRGGWKDEFSSCAEWLAWRTGIKIGPARERVRAARALENLPRTSEALRSGQLSYAKVRAITRVATAESEETLLEFARAASAARLEQRVRMWKQLSREGELTAEQVRHRNRALSVFVDGDGMYAVRGRLEPEVGAMLMRAIEAAADALYRREATGGKDVREDRVRERIPKPTQRWADAIGLVAERALAAGFGEDSEDGPDESGTRAERYQVVIHTEAATLAEHGEPGRSDLDGVRVSSETSRRMACDAATVEMVHDMAEKVRGEAEMMPAGAASGPVLSVGRRTRTIPPHIRRALEERDRGCRFPGCASRFTEAHHVRHWADGGETSLSNLLLLCRRHHRAVHEGRVRVCTDRAGLALFLTRKGRALADVPDAAAPVIRAGAHATPALAQATSSEVCSTTFSNGAALYRDSDIPWAIEARAREAVEETL